MHDFVTVTTTTDDRGVADAIARGAIERRVGACARILTAQSVYRWEGEVCVAAEFVVEIKTSSVRAPQVESLIRELHGYELPEVVVHPIIGGSKAYLDWLSAEVDAAS